MLSSVTNLCESFSNGFLAPGTKKATLTLKRRVLKLARSLCCIVQSCEQDLNTFLCFYRAKQTMAAKLMRRVTNTLLKC